MLAGAAPTARADSPDPAPLAGTSSTNTGGTTKVISVPIKIVAEALASAKATASSSATASAYATAGAQVRSKSKTKKASCFWSTGINTYYSGGKLRTYYDPVKAKVCKLKKAKKAGGTKWYYKKVAGGTSGSHCNNLFKPKKIKVSYKRATVLDVKAGSKACVLVTSTASASVDVAVKLTLEYTVNGVTKRIYKEAKGSGHDSETKRAYACSTITKKSSTKTMSGKIASVKKSVSASASASARANAIAEARANARATIELVIEIEVPNKPPAGDIIGPQHLYEGGTATYRAYGWDPEDGSDVTLDISVSGAATGGTTVRDYVKDGKKAKEFLITAGDTAGTATITLTVTDSKGAVFTKTASFPVKPNETGDSSGR